MAVCRDLHLSSKPTLSKAQLALLGVIYSHQILADSGHDGPTLAMTGFISATFELVQPISCVMYAAHMTVTAVACGGMNPLAHHACPRPFASCVAQNSVILTRPAMARNWD